MVVDSMKLMDIEGIRKGVFSACNYITQHPGGRMTEKTSPKMRHLVLQHIPA